MSEKQSGPHPRRSATPPLPNRERGLGGEGFKPTELGDLPVEWDVVRLKDIIQTGKSSLNPQEFPTEKFDYYSIPAYQVSDNPFIEVGQKIRSQKLLVETGTVLFGKLNPRVPKIWRVLSESERRKIASTEFMPLVPKKDKTDFQFLYYLARSEYILPKSQELVSGSTPSRQRVDHKSFVQIPIPLPPLDEQRRIAHVLNTVQQAIAAQDDLIAAAQEVKRSLMRRLFTTGPGPEPAPTQEAEIGEVPEHWEVVRLGEVARIERGKFAHRPRNAPQFYGGKIPFIQTGDVAQANGRITTYSQTLNELGLSISRMFPKGTIVITIAANIGFTGILEFDSAFPDSLIGITPQGSIYNVFLEYYLQTQQPKMDEMAPRGTQKNINIQFLKPWPVLKPSLDEQYQIAHILQAADAKIAAEQDRRAALRELFNSLLQALMTGRRRV